MVRTLLCWILGLSLSAQAVEFISLDQHPSIKNPIWMENSVQVQITPRGQRLFSENLVQVLTNLGVVINENYFPEFHYVSEEPIRIDELAEKQPEQFEMLMKVRQFFRQYLKGIQFKDFRPSITLGPSEYIAEFDKVALVTDEELMKKLGKSEGAVLAIEVKIRSLKAQANRIDAEDLENKWFGKIGITNPYLQVGTKENPFVARMPFYVKANGDGTLEFEALQVEENLNSVALEVRYQKLILPEFEFKVVGQDETYKISLDADEFKKIVDEQLPEGLKMVRQYVRDFLQNDFPKLLNQKAQEALRDELEQIQSLPAAGTKPDDPRPPLSLGLRLNKVDLRDRNLQIGLSAFAEDTSTTAQAGFWQGSGARGAPVFNHIHPQGYDLAISVDRAVFNRIVHLSFNRKNFKEMETCPGTPTIELLNPPAIEYSKPTRAMGDLETMLKLYIDANVKTPPEYTTGFFAPLKPKLRLKFQYQAILKPVTPGSVKLGIYPTGVDLKTLQVDDSSLTTIGKLFKNKVVSEISKFLSEGSGCGNNAPLAEFELINSLWGVPIEYVKVKMDPQGQLMLYMNYKMKEAL